LLRSAFWPHQKNLYGIIDLPPDLLADHAIGAMLLIGQESLEFDWTGGKLYWSFRPECAAREEGHLRIVAAHRIGCWSRIAASSAGIEAILATPTLIFQELSPKGLACRPKSNISLSIFANKTRKPVPQASLELVLAAVPLPRHENPKFCAE
jgi:hypothetical protein|tara:strand:- start:227 stop:682 length:456 start_codon:yes stop_codon:yes gene_type:complete